MRPPLPKITLLSFLSTILVACGGAPPDKLGVQNDQLRPCPPSPNCVSSQAPDAGQRIDPLVFRDDRPERAFARLKQILESRNDATIKEEKPGYLRVELRTALFVDDGEFLLDEERRLIHVRSASRLGYWDLGKNRRRVEEIRREFARAEDSPKGKL
jgi:uncharacterized protein (DUF1499 family)